MSVISVQFKNRAMEFGGRTYDFELVDAIAAPQVGDVIRMLSADGTKAVCNGTRVKVIAVKEASDCIQPQIISYSMSSMDEPSLTGL